VTVAGLGATRSSGTFETKGGTCAPGTRARLIAFYLPQFHPIPENDRWWGTGFTEWTTVARARPLFPGHYQPRVPADLGFYDLRLPEVRAAQADLARSAGVEGFCYWHYWFAGKQLLERPFNEVLRLGEPDLPFCLAWANHSWTGAWRGAPKDVLIEQTYPGRGDHERHFDSLLAAFHDPRYIRVRGEPVFVVYNPLELPHAARFIEAWQELAAKNGLPGIHFVAHVGFDVHPYDHRSHGFAAAIFFDVLGVSVTSAWQRSLAWCRAQPTQTSRVRAVSTAMYHEGRRAFRYGLPAWHGTQHRQGVGRESWRTALRRHLPRPRVFEYSEAMLHFLSRAKSDPGAYPCLLPNWDHSPRLGSRAIVLHNSTPELFRQPLRKALDLVAERPHEDRLIFVKSWNEWGEGNYLEPDLRFGRGYLDVLRDEVFEAARESRHG